MCICALLPFRSMVQLHGNDWGPSILKSRYIFHMVIFILTTSNELRSCINLLCLEMSEENVMVSSSARILSFLYDWKCFLWYISQSERSMSKFFRFRIATTKTLMIRIKKFPYCLILRLRIHGLSNASFCSPWIFLVAHARAMDSEQPCRQNNTKFYVMKRVLILQLVLFLLFYLRIKQMY